MLFLDWKRCEGVVSLDELDGICGGIEVTVVETHWWDGIYPLEDGRAREVAISPRNLWNVLVVVIMESNELEYESLIRWTNMKPWE